MSDENKVENQEQQEQQAQFDLQIHRIYVKDVSFEAPNLPHIFNQEWDPELSFGLDSETNIISEEHNLYEVTLNVNVSTKIKESDDVAFVCELKQSGLFQISGIEGIELAHCLSSYCPNILYPYARELVSSLVNRGTFPALNLSPVNFDALFEQFVQQQIQEQEQEEKAEQEQVN